MAFGPIMQLSVGEHRIELAPFSKEDMAEFISPGMNRYSVNKYLSHHTSHTIEDEQEWYEKIRTETNSIRWGIWIVEGDKRTLIGESSVFDIFINDAKIHQATSGSLIFRKEYWGGGIASAAHKARTWYAFQHLGMHRIMSAVIHGNVGSLKALTRSGYIPVYVERNTVFVDGKARHQDNLECLNPNEPFWSWWWNGDRPTERARKARALTREALDWAEENVDLL